METVRFGTITSPPKCEEKFISATGKTPLGKTEYLAQIEDHILDVTVIGETAGGKAKIPLARSNRLVRMLSGFWGDQNPKVSLWSRNKTNINKQGIDVRAAKKEIRSDILELKKFCDNLPPDQLPKPPGGRSDSGFDSANWVANPANPASPLYPF